MGSREAAAVARAASAEQAAERAREEHLTQRAASAAAAGQTISRVNAEHLAGACSSALCSDDVHDHMRAGWGLPCLCVSG